MTLSTTTTLFDRFFADLDSAFPPRVSAVSPAVDLLVYEDRFELVADLPGLSREDVDIHYGNGRLTLRAQRESEVPEGARLVRRERAARAFSRSFALGEEVDVDGIQASMNDGVLRITLPKSERARPRQIEVKVN